MLVMSYYCKDENGDLHLYPNKLYTQAELDQRIEEACRKQREICRDVAVSWCHADQVAEPKYTLAEAILNAPKPERKEDE